MRRAGWRRPRGRSRARRRPARPNTVELPETSAVGTPARRNVAISGRAAEHQADARRRPRRARFPAQAAQQASALRLGEGVDEIDLAIHRPPCYLGDMRAQPEKIRQFLEHLVLDDRRFWRSMIRRLLAPALRWPATITSIGRSPIAVCRFLALGRADGIRVCARRQPVGRVAQLPPQASRSGLLRPVRSDQGRGELHVGYSVLRGPLRGHLRMTKDHFWRRKESPSSWGCRRSPRLGRTHRADPRHRRHHCRADRQRQIGVGVGAGRALSRHCHQCRCTPVLL